MGLLDKVEKEAKDKKKRIIPVQVKIPEDLHKEVSKILAERELSWQKALMAAIHMIRDESKKK